MSTAQGTTIKQGEGGATMLLLKWSVLPFMLCGERRTLLGGFTAHPIMLGGLLEGETVTQNVVSTDGYWRSSIYNFQAE